MEERGYRLQFRDLWKERLSAAELEKLIGDGDHIDFLNKKERPLSPKENAGKSPRAAKRSDGKEPT